MDFVSTPALDVDFRNKHKKDWKPFDRQRPPSWMQLGATGIDDKRRRLTNIV